MVYSGFEDNWESVVTINTIARAKYFDSDNSPMQRGLQPLIECPFDACAHEMRREESRLVGIAMVWSIATIESLANHILADTINDNTLAIKAIEFPKVVINQFAKNSVAKTDLARKIEIISCGSNQSAISNLADTLSFTRNSIIHDKPFELYTNQDGNCVIYNFLTKGERKRFYYPDLKAFYANCDTLIQNLHQTCDFPFRDYEFIKFADLYTVGA